MHNAVRFLLVALAAAPPVRAGGTVATQPVAFSVETSDAVTIQGHLYRRGGDALVIYCHGLLAGEDRLEAERLLDALGPRFDLLTFDFRGHGDSFGSSTMGRDEVLDVRAVIAFAHGAGYGRIALLGAGMGATAAARAALIFGNVDALVAVSPSGFSPEIIPPITRMLRSLVLDTAYGEVTIRLFANTRLRPREYGGYPLDIVTEIGSPPILVIDAENDRQTELKTLQRLMRERIPSATVRLVPGRGHGEELLDDAVLGEVRAFLESSIPAASGAGSAPPAREPPSIRGDLPLPAGVVRDDLEARRPAAMPHAVARRIEDVFAFRGYVFASVSPADSAGAVVVESPRIGNITLAGNRRVSEDYLRSVLGVGGGHFNTWEMDAGIRRLTRDPAVRAVRESIRRRPDGDVDIELEVRETSPARFFVSAKFTDIDHFYGAGATWNEFNPTALQVRARALYGIDGGRFLDEVRLGRHTLGDALFLSLTQYNMIRSRDELEFVFPRQEVHNIGGEAAARYRVSRNVSVELGAFGQRDRKPEDSPELPVEEGVAAGGVARLDLAGRLPLQGDPRLHWRQTAYYSHTGLFDAGDFDFETYQWNISAEVPVARHVSTLATAHAGRVTGGAPPQNLMSLGGMHTLPGYEDDEFVDSRMALASIGLYISARRLVDERSRWAPLRMIVAGRTGMTWGRRLDYDTRRLATSVVVEVDYRRLARVGIAVPAGGMRGDAGPQFFVGWGEHVQW